MRGAWAGVAVIVVAALIAVAFIRMPKFTLPPSPDQTEIADTTKTLAMPNLPDNLRADALSRRAAAYRRTGRTDLAAKDYRALLKLQIPNSADYDQVHALLIQTYSGAGDFHHAMAEWKVYAAEPHHEYSSLLLRAEIYRQMHDDRAELADLDAAVTRFPFIAEGRLQRAQYYLLHGDPDRATADVDAAEKSDPGNENIHPMRMMIAAQKGDLGSAWREFKTTADASSARARVADLETRAQNESAGGDYGKAIADYSLLIAKNPDNATYRDARAELYLWRGDDALAYADYQKAIDLQPTLPDPYLALAIAYDARFRFDDAWPEFKYAVVYSGEATPHRVRAFTEMELNRDDDASADYIAALKLDPTDEYSMIGLHAVRLHQHRDDRAELAGYAAAVTTLHDWPRPLLDYQRGLITRVEADREALNAPGSDTPAQHQGVIAYFAGKMALDRGDRKAAIPDLQAAVKACPPSFPEHFMALWALKQAGAAS